MNRMAMCTALTVGVLLGACSSGEDDDSSINTASVQAPTSVAGKTFNISIESGNGVFANTGTTVVSISSNRETYVLTGDGVNTADSAGTYSYEAVSNRGRFSFDDSAAGQGLFEFIYLTSTSGEFVATLVIDQGARQTGTFFE